MNIAYIISVMPVGHWSGGE